jgi:predicted molibdopterin-dependent oxidoreductase YjgC
VDVCPTGSLSARGGKWYGDADRCTDSTCLLCSVGCTFSYESKWNKIMGSIPKRDGPTKGQACSRGRFCIPQLFNGPDRLKQPMIRKDGKLVPVNWDEAISYTAEKLKEFKSDEIGIIASSFLTNESAYVLQKFTRVVLKTNNIDSPTSDFTRPIIKTILESKNAQSKKGKIKILEESQWIIVLSRNIFLPSSALIPSIYRAKKNGAKIILIDKEKRRKTPKIVDETLILDAKQTMNLFYCLIHKLSNSKSNLSNDFVKILKKLNINNLKKGITKDIENVLAVIESSKGSIILDPGFSQNPEHLLSAITNLLILLDNPDGFIPYYQGGNNQGIFDVGAINDYLPGYVKPKKKGKKYNEMLNGGVKALYLTEPASVKNLKNIEFLILQDIYPSKIMNKADVVLPACAFTEENGTVTSFERRIQKVKKAANGPGLARPDWKIICEMAKKMDAKGFDYKNHQNIFNEIKDTIPFISGTGIWSLTNTKPKLIPLTTNKIKDVPSTKPQFYYRGANLIERVNDFKVQIENGGA